MQPGPRDPRERTARAARAGHVEKLDPLVRPDGQDPPAHQGPPVPPAPPVLTATAGSLVNRAPVGLTGALERWAHLASPAHKDLRAHKAHLEREVLLAKMVPLGHLDQGVLPGM